MWDRIFNAFKSEFSLSQMSSLLSVVRDLVDHFEEDYVKDKDARNAAIDAICELLQAQKTK